MEKSVLLIFISSFLILRYDLINLITSFNSSFDPDKEPLIPSLAINIVPLIFLF